MYPVCLRQATPLLVNEQGCRSSRGMTTKSIRALHHYHHKSRYDTKSKHAFTLWAHEDLNLGPLPCQRNSRHAIYQHKRGLTCGDAFVVVRHLLVVALCFAGFPRDGILHGLACRAGRRDFNPSLSWRPRRDPDQVTTRCSDPPSPASIIHTCVMASESAGGSVGTPGQLIGAK